jgi:hypothetical protein
MALLKEVTVVAGTYTNAKGEEKKRYIRIGSVIDTKNGAMLKLDVMPIYAGWDGWAYMNDPKPKEYKGLPADNDEDIGF